MAMQNLRARRDQISGKALIFLFLIGLNLAHLLVFFEQIDDLPLRAHGSSWNHSDFQVISHHELLAAPKKAISPAQQMGLFSLGAPLLLKMTFPNSGPGCIFRLDTGQPGSSPLGVYPKSPMNGARFWGALVQRCVLLSSFLI